MKGTPGAPVTAAAGTVGASKTAVTSPLPRALFTAVLAVLAGAGAYKAHQAWQLRGEVARLHEEQAPLVEQVQQLSQQLAAATNQLAALREGQDGLARGNAELLRLRRDVTALRRENGELRALVPPSEQRVEAIGPALGKLVVAGDEIYFEDSGPLPDRVALVNDISTRKNCFLDFDTGALLTPPEKVVDRERMITWAREQGAEVFGDGHGLSSLYWGICGRRGDGTWAGATGQDVVNAVRDIGRFSGQWPPRVTFSDPGPDWNSAPAFLLKTRQDGLVMLQMTGLSENPAGLSIRYKLLPGGDRLPNLSRLKGRVTDDAEEPLNGVEWQTQRIEQWWDGNWEPAAIVPKGPPPVFATDSEGRFTLRSGVCAKVRYDLQFVKEGFGSGLLTHVAPDAAELHVVMRRL